MIDRPPKETSRWGDVESIRPSNIVYVQVPKSEYRSIRDEVYNWNKSSDVKEGFRRLHNALHARGYTDFRPSMEKVREITREPEQEGPVDNDTKWARMSQKDFEKWRNQQEAERRARR